jgi:hypothetical protein
VWSMDPMAGPLPKPSPPTARVLPTKPAGATPARTVAAKAAPPKAAPPKDAPPKDASPRASGAPAAATPAKALGKANARPLAKPAAKKASSARASALPRERKTLDGPWEWAFDRMLERKRVADAALKQEARQAAKRANAQRPPAPPTV